MNVTQEFLAVKNNSHPISEMLEDSDLRRAYNTQYRNAKRRGIGFHLSYEEWLLVWVASGKLHLRGKHGGQYQMCRFNDSGDYVIGNVYIAQMEKNLHDAHYGKAKKPAHRRKLKRQLDENRKYVTVTIDGITYTSLTAAAKAHNVSQPTIKDRCNSKNPKWAGWHFEAIKRGDRVVSYLMAEKDFAIDDSDIDMNRLVRGDFS